MEKRSSWEIQKAVINSLFLREMKTRFGAYNLGYFWALIQPASIILILWTIMSFRTKNAISGIEFTMILFTGLLPYRLFANIVTRLANGISSNKGLFNYRQVKPIDTMIARCILESLVYFMVFIFLIIVGTIIGFNTKITHIPALILVSSVLITFAFSLGLLFAILGAFSENIPKFIEILMRLIFYSSGVFFSIHSIPEEYRWFLLLNPMLNFIELLRWSYFGETYPLYADPFYVFWWTISITLLALWLNSKLQNRIIAS